MKEKEENGSSSVSKMCKYVTAQHNTYNIQSGVCVCVCKCVYGGIIESVPPHIWRHPLGGFFHLLICELPAKAEGKPGIVLIRAGNQTMVSPIISQGCVPAEVLQPSQNSHHVCVGSRESSDDKGG